MSAVMSVTGPVPVRDLGVTLAHEHLLMDGMCLWRQPTDVARSWLVDAHVTPELFPELAVDPYHSRDNVRLDDPHEALRDLLAYRMAGGNSIVDLSSREIGPFPEHLRTLSEQSGLNVIAGTGFYIRKAHPKWVALADVRAVADAMRRDLLFGFNDTHIRAGVIGELGTSSPIHQDEVKVLRAAAAVQREVGVGINVHLTLFAKEGMRVLDILEASGADLSRVALSHLDETLDFDYHRGLAARGAFLEFDTWGSECEFRESRQREPMDGQRADALSRLADAGYIDQLLLSQDVCTKMQRRSRGGPGYDHILVNVLPRLRQRGFAQADFDQMLITNPSRFLTGDSAPFTKC